MSITGRYITMRGGNIIGTPPVIVPPSLLLDLYPNAAAAYSLRLLRTAYSGSAIRVRRSSDNTEQDIGFVGNDLDTASLLSFVGAGDGFVTTWYDQSINTFNAFNISASVQPLIVSSGILITQGSVPAVYTPGLKNLNTGLVNIGVSGNISLDFFAVMNNESSGNGNHLIGLSNLTTTVNRSRVLFFANDSSTSKSVRLYGGFTVYQNSNSGQLLFNTNYQGGGGAFDSRVNGNSLSVSSFSNLGLQINEQSGFMLMSGRSSNQPQLDYANPNSVGYVQESIFFLTDESANRTAIETNINNYYGIY
jgi:hypothetical protein